MTGAEAVTVSQAEHLAADLDPEGLRKDPHPHVLEIVIAPDVVIPGEEVHRHACIHQVHQRGKDAHAPLRDDVTVFIPEIPDVAQQVERRRPVFRDAPQETDEARLPVGGIRDIQPQMHVGNKVCQRTLLHGLKRRGR